MYANEVNNLLNTLTCQRKILFSKRVEINIFK